jgi:uncharacterized protein YyaL (SSP411 family)
MANHNHLSQETSLYLQQHATNPVEWHPWNEATLKKARDLKKPILLSIGYAACHWCHVMAHESFEDPNIAAVMNQHFINIKVDKEERPDLDKIYQTSLQLLTRRTGGWPLTMFLHYDDLSPFFGGTYFPNIAKFGMPAFGDLLNQIASFFEQEQDSIRTKQEPFKKALQELLAPEKQTVSKLDDKVLNLARHQLGGSYDPRFSGFGHAPKFPHPQNIDRLFMHWYANPNDKGAYNMPLETLRTLARSGIYDQIGGGFFRYSVDEEWQIPHFEKMLYDNALLLDSYAMAYRISPEPIFKETMLDIVTWLNREMNNHYGAFYSSMDADTEGKEGHYYVWTQEQIKELLTPEELELVSNYYGLYNKANFEEQWHLHAATDFASCCENNNYDAGKAAQLLASAKQKLFNARAKRTLPQRDSKILTSWNSALAKALLNAGSALQDTSLQALGFGILDFLYQNVWVNQQLYAVYDGKQAKNPAYLDDYAFLLDALLTSLQINWRTDWLNWAVTLADQLIDQFEDKQQGGFYFTANNTESLLARPKPLMDESMPSGNAIATLALIRLGYLLGNSRYLDAAQHSLEYAFPAIEEVAFAYNSFLNALEEYFSPPEIIILRGKVELMKAQYDKLMVDFSPHRMVFSIPAEENNLPEALMIKKPQGDIVGYSCKGNSCEEFVI